MRSLQLLVTIFLLQEIFRLSCSLSWICAAGSPADVEGTTPDETAEDSTPGGDAPLCVTLSGREKVLCSITDLCPQGAGSAEAKRCC